MKTLFLVLISTVSFSLLSCPTLNYFHTTCLNHDGSKEAVMSIETLPRKQYILDLYFDSDNPEKRKLITDGKKRQKKYYNQSISSNVIENLSSRCFNRNINVTQEIYSDDFFQTLLATINTKIIKESETSMKLEIEVLSSFAGNRKEVFFCQNAF
jgi:hypothetical protein